ncbi:NACHT, LRR and PYD domains-containing protein 3-like isoform X2 [Mobula birostris]|uniref:NACHT, LRR and PYD domains-containing protein 3-like isoform X2 n=1 Tax=Mobula birostris TaxID=1983395 RepID=UPI003B281036
MAENSKREGDAESVLSRKNTDGNFKRKFRRHLSFGSSREDDGNSKPAQAPQDYRTPAAMKSACTSWDGDLGTSASRKQRAGEHAFSRRFKQLLPFGSSRENGQNAGGTRAKQGYVEGCIPLENDSASEEREQIHPRALFDTETQDCEPPVTMKSRCSNSRGEAGTPTPRKGSDGKLKFKRHLSFGSSREDNENSKPAQAPQDYRTPAAMKSACTSWDGDLGTSASRKQRGGEHALNQGLKRLSPFGSSRENGQNAGGTRAKQGYVEGCIPLENDSASEEREQIHPRALFDTETQDCEPPVTMKSRCSNSRGEAGTPTPRKGSGWKSNSKRKQKLKGLLPLDSPGENDQTSGAPISVEGYIEGCGPMEYDATEEEREQSHPRVCGVGDSVQGHGTSPGETTSCHLKGSLNKESLGLDQDGDPKTEILEPLSHCDDFQLANFYGQRLTPAIEERVEEFSLILREEGHFSGQEHEEVADLAEKGDRAESSKLLFGLVMKKGAQTRKVMWESFVKMQNQLPKLDKILKEILEFGPDPGEYMDISFPQGFGDLSSQLKDVQQKHKETLRAQTETLRANTILMTEKVKAFQLVDQYTKLTVISTVRLRRLVEDELLATGRDHEELRMKQLQRELEIIQTDQLFQSSFSRGKSKSGSSAAVVGIPGIGKTTMMQKIVYDWATGKIYQQFRFVFSFKFQDLNFIKSRITLRQLILDQYPYFEKILREVWNNPKGLLFIFDGLDQFKHKIDFADSRRDTEPKHQCPDPEWWCEVSDIVYGLIQHKLLPGCSVLVTTRPTELHLLEKAEICVRAEILGFVGEERKEYFNRFFEDQTVAAAVFKHVEENDILYTMSFNPSYCWILVLALGPFFTKKDRDPQRVPKTVTQLYCYYLYNILKNHGREIENPRDVLVRVGQMAFTGVSQRKVVFTDGDLNSCNLQPSQFLSGFLMELLERKDSAWSVVYTFPHLTVQEFVAALAQFLTASGRDIPKLLTEAHSTTDGRFEMFLRFVAGLSSPARVLEELLGPFPNDTACRVIDWVKEEFKRQLENSWSKLGKRSLLNTLHCLFESRNRELAQATLGSVETLSFSGLPLTLIDCTVLSHVIESCDAMKHLDLTGCHIQSEGLQRLRSRLHKCQELGMADNNLGDSVMHLVSALLRTPDCIVQRLELASNHLTDSGVKEIASALNTNRSLTVLNLGINKLGDSGVKLVSSALRDTECKIQALELRCVGLTDSGAENLVSALSTSQSLAELDLRLNSLTDRSVPCLCRLILTLPTLKRIRLCDNRFSSAGGNQLKCLQESRPGLTVEL